MTDEGVASKDQTTPAARVAKHHQQKEALLGLCERLLDRSSLLRDVFTAELQNLAASDPAYIEALSTVMNRGQRGPLSRASLSPVFTAFVSNVALLAPDNVSNVSNVGVVARQVTPANVTNVMPVASSPPPPPPPPPDPPSPVAPSTALTTTRGTLRPSDGTLRSAQGVEGGRRDPHFEALADALYPGLEGEYAGMDDRARGQCARALQQIKRAEDKRGVPVEVQPERIKRAVANWPNVKGSEPITPTKVAGNWTALTAGIQVGGRDNGTVRHHHQYLNESAVVKHQPKLNSPEVYRRD